ncbi:hypothetical protein LTR09_004454 [Extremus antarcticus]|uniref:Uncharacterized protein n=1 Tax=Extremus antarcticus TaxID=702011 RepID=A0AAJ0DQ77_9PEZI|nr:hypothetical protein LTR09_004454 [Extremus antarcticus]
MSSPPQPATACFTTDFDPDETPIPYRGLGGIGNEGRINRMLVTHDAIRDTSFSATLQRVHYGTYQSRPACLVVLDCAFHFPPRALSRYICASIKLAFRHATDPTDPKVRSPDVSHDPAVVNLAPKEVYGIVTTVEQKYVRDVTIPLMFESPIGLSTGIEGHIGTERSGTQDNRMELHGCLLYSDDHDEAYGAAWSMYENPAHRDGILRSLRLALVLCHAVAQPMWMKVIVKPSVQFSVNPERWFGKNEVFATLLQKNDEPVLLDGKTSKSSDGTQISYNEFSSGKFPWMKVLWWPEEYKMHGVE